MMLKTILTLLMTLSVILHHASPLTLKSQSNAPTSTEEEQLKANQEKRQPPYYRFIDEPGPMDALRYRQRSSTSSSSASPSTRRRYSSTSSSSVSPSNSRRHSYTNSLPQSGDRQHGHSSSIPQSNHQPFIRQNSIDQAQSFDGPHGDGSQPLIKQPAARRPSMFTRFRNIFSTEEERAARRAKYEEKKRRRREQKEEWKRELAHIRSLPKEERRQIKDRMLMENFRAYNLWKAV